MLVICVVLPGVLCFGDFLCTPVPLPPKNTTLPKQPINGGLGVGRQTEQKREGESGRKGLIVKPFVNIVFSNIGRETAIVFGICCTLVYLRPKFVEIGNRNFKS